jgi:hypothetical protein
MGTVRRHVHVKCAPDTAWSLVGDPTRLHEWFPMESCRVEGHKRWVTLPSQLVLEEDIITHDHDAFRFQYEIVNNFLITQHRSTLDVIDDGNGHCIIIYSTDVKPDVFALIIGGAAGEGLERARRILEGT